MARYNGAGVVSATINKGTDVNDNCALLLSTTNRILALSSVSGPMGLHIAVFELKALSHSLIIAICSMYREMQHGTTFSALLMQLNTSAHGHDPEPIDVLHLGCACSKS